MQRIPTGANQNPFLASLGNTSPFAPQAPVADEAPEGSYEYVLVPSAPEVPAGECESTSAAIEIRILWGTSVLEVAHLTPPRSFYVGDEQAEHAKCDVVLPSERIGTSRMPVVLAERDGTAHIVLPQNASGFIQFPGQPSMSIEDAAARGLTQPCAELSGARQAALPAGAKARVTLGDFTFEVGAVNAGRVVAGRLQIDERALPYQGLSIAAHVGLLAAMAIFMPPLAMAEEDSSRSDQVYSLTQAMDAIAETERDARQTEQLADSHADDHEGGEGTAAKGESGKMGSATSRDTNKRWGLKGPAENADPHLAKAAALADARDFGMVGLLNTLSGGDPDAPTAPWGREDSLGRDPLSARGNMWGQDIGEAAGGNGLGLTGIGEGGGSLGEGIGVGKLGFGHGGCTSLPCGDGSGFGKGHGFLARGHKPEGVRMRQGETVASGHLPPEIIQRIVRQNFGRFRLCYENGLRAQPNLQGRVAVRFVIGRDGSISNVSNGGSDIPDGGVVSCVVRAFYGLSFPAPETGIVTVTYPIMFAPSGA